MDINIRKSSTFAAVILAAFLATISVAAACVTFKGQMTVDGHDRDTWVKGTGNQHAYCSDGHPQTAAAGHLTDDITITVDSASCTDPGAAGDHQLPEGTYQVRYNNRESYAFDGTAYRMVPLSGCFFAANAPTTSTIGTFGVDSTGYGTWTGDLDPINPGGVAAYSVPGTASNLCVGDPSAVYDPTVDSGGPPGMLAPYELLAI